MEPELPCCGCQHPLAALEPGAWALQADTRVEVLLAQECAGRFPHGNVTTGMRMDVFWSLHGCSALCVKQLWINIKQQLFLKRIADKFISPSWMHRHWQFLVMLDKNHNCWCMGSFSVSYVGGEKRTKILIDINKLLFTEVAVILCSYSLFPGKLSFLPHLFINCDLIFFIQGSFNRNQINLNMGKNKAQWGMRKQSRLGKSSCPREWRILYCV